MLTGFQGPDLLSIVRHQTSAKVPFTIALMLEVFISKEKILKLH